MTAAILPLDREARLLGRIADGDQGALVELYRENRKPVLSFILRNNGTTDDAEDLLQEALVVVWERVRSGRFEHSARIGTFVYATVRNIWLRRLARRRREVSGDTAQMNAATDAPSPLEALMEREEASMVRDALDRLGDPCRRLLLMYYWEELPMAQIAVALGFANTDTVKSKKYQCKKTLEQMLRTMMT